MMKTLAIAGTLAALLTGSAVQAADSASYEVRFDATWTAQSHPMDYPAGAHFSGLIGTTHNKSYQIFADGRTATPGLKALSEMGAHTPLNREIDKAVKAGKAGGLFESDPLFSFPGTIKASFTATESHPYASAVAMVAPSPDWFTGVSSVPLRKDGQWVSQVTLALFVWDAGTDLGTTYTAADAPARPRQSVRLNAAPQFTDGLQIKQVGTVTFTRVDKSKIN